MSLMELIHRLVKSSRKFKGDFMLVIILLIAWSESGQLVLDHARQD